MILGRESHVHSSAFDELDGAVSALKNETGDRRLVCFNAHAFSPPLGAILFNLENIPAQLSAAVWPDWEVWDFSASNVEKLRANPKRTAPVHHVSLGYHISMTQFEAKLIGERTTDVVFTGTINARREAVIRELVKRGFVVEIVPHTLYGAERNEIMARSKLALNVRFYEEGLYPQLRTLHALANGILTVSEKAPETPAWSPNAVAFEHVPDVVELLLRMPIEDLEAKTDDAVRALKRYRMQLPSPE